MVAPRDKAGRRSPQTDAKAPVVVVVVETIDLASHRQVSQHFYWSERLP